ncbi:hypothetical protein [Wolbachia endosymbiont (group A) of Sphaerophoria taeniata]|uniref:hypothetical protein n=1 Tax=Wolbachia endosymbiont (group A) of Sphaerophoria taeniata TaxID=2954057 RepID=UPI002225FB47|nr:hypothetical protein [Wolbachia endosymbiont (group A) of Sphaerophoria taeniata]
MENHAKESIKHKVVLPNSKTINIEGTNFKYEIHYDQLDDKDLLMIEKYANHIFHAYQERYGLDMNTDHTVKGFIYNNLTDFRSATNLGDGITVHATSNNHRYPHNSGSVAHHDLTTAIYFTLSLYNKEKYGIPPNENRFIRNVAEELKAIGLDDNQGELNTEQKPETTIYQEKQEKELKESDQQDVITTTDHPLDDYNYDYHLIDW